MEIRAAGINFGGERLDEPATGTSGRIVKVGAVGYRLPDGRLAGRS
jgi:hypothetical protein